MGALLGWLMGFLSLFLIMLILIQRGKGGGLTGALGGPGGQSAFGSKAGDTFTLITVVVASIWGFTCAFTMWLLGTHTPTTVTRTNVSAGPAEEEPDNTGNELIIPPAGGFGGLSSGDTDVTSSSPSLDLTPADSTSETPASETPAGETTESEATESDPAADDADTTSTESPTPNADADSPDSANTDLEEGGETDDN